MKTLQNGLFLAFIASIFCFTNLQAQDAVEGKVITGDVQVQFGAASDVYQLNGLQIFNSSHSLLLSNSGKITRTSSNAEGRKSPGILFDLSFEGTSKQGKAPYGSWSGFITQEAESGGRVGYSFGTDATAPLQINNPSGKVSEAKFSGRMIVPQKDKAGSASAVSISRMGDGKKLKYSTASGESLSLQSFVLAKGPSLKHPEAKVSGELVYERSSKSWLVNGVAFSYSASGKPVTDKVVGGMAWTENAKGQPAGGTYDVAFVFNDEVNGSGDVVEIKEGDLRQFVNASSDVATIYGRITISEEVGADKKVSSSRINFDLSAKNGVKEHQVMNVFKFLMSVFVPFNS